jgi:hypothetical protein
MHLRPFALLVSAAAPLACATSSELRSKPPLEVEADHFVGTIWTGPLAGPEPRADDVPWWLRLRVGYLDAQPEGPSERLASRLDRVFVERAGRPLATRSELAQGVLGIDGGAEVAGQETAAPLWTGTTTLWRVVPATGIVDPPHVPWRLAQIELTRPSSPGAQPEIALVFEGEVIPRADDEDSEETTSRKPAAPILQREHVVLPPAPFGEGAARRFFLPAPRRAISRGGFAIEIARVAADAAGASADALERGRSALGRSAAKTREDTSPVTADESFRFESVTALPALERADLRRSALVFLAQVARAPLAGDLALDAEPDALAGFAATLAPLVRGDAHGGREPPALGWALERAAYDWLAEAALDEKHPLPKELESLLVAHAGELGRFPELLRAAVLECDGIPALGERLVQENRIFLEDADPSARLRAFEWLQARGAAPESFDPLAPLAERRGALERARETADQAREAAEKRKEEAR